MVANQCSGPPPRLPLSLAHFSYPDQHYTPRSQQRYTWTLSHSAHDGLSNMSQSYQFRRKPIYDSQVPTRNTAPLPDRPSEPQLIAETEATYTNKLASYVKEARMFTHAHVDLAERKFNDSAKRFFDIENNVTSTIADLAPDPRTGEKVLPGALYVVVAGMAGSIMTRNRNILLRATVPVALAVGASKYLLPHTTRNVSELVWSWEKKFPVVADGHLRARQFVETGVEHSKMGVIMAREKVDESVRKSRETLEGWVKQGR